MPTVVLLDVSLSMVRPIMTSDGLETNTRLTLAQAAVTMLLDYLKVHAKLEYVALVAYSGTAEVIVPFTREYEVIKLKLMALEEGDRTCVVNALNTVNQLVINEWGSQTPVQIIVITDGSAGVGSANKYRAMNGLPTTPPVYPQKIHVLPIVSAHDPCLFNAMPIYHKIVELTLTNGNTPRSSFHFPDQLTIPAINAAMLRLCEAQYSEYVCVLRCGHLETKVHLFPTPTSDGKQTSDILIDIIGFIPQHEIGTPISESKHLVIPIPNTGLPRDNLLHKNKDGYEVGGEEEMADPSKIPNFCVLLHGALKVEGMCAVVQLMEGTWGTLVASCEVSRARRSCLLLSIFKPSPLAAPWLGPLDQLGPLQPQGNETVIKTEPYTPPMDFPIRASRSYNAGATGTVWARPHALLADVQKIMRHARKLPEKTQHLFKELNRLRRSAIALGFSDLLICVGRALEREASMLEGDVQEQLSHAGTALQKAKDARVTIYPLPVSPPLQ